MTEQDNIEKQNPEPKDPLAILLESPIQQEFMEARIVADIPPNLNFNHLNTYNLHVADAGFLTSCIAHLMQPAIDLAATMLTQESILGLYLSETDDIKNLHLYSYMLQYSSLVGNLHKNIAVRSMQDFLRNRNCPKELREKCETKLEQFESLFAQYYSNSLLDRDHNGVSLREIYALPTPLSVESLQTIYPLFEKKPEWDAEQFLAIVRFVRASNVQEDLNTNPLTASVLPKMAPELLKPRQVSTNFFAIFYNALLFNRYNIEKKQLKDIDLQAVFNLLTPNSFLNIFLGIKTVGDIALTPTSFRELMYSNFIPGFPDNLKELLIQKQKEIFSSFRHGNEDENIARLYRTNQASDFAQTILDSVSDEENGNRDISLFLNNFETIKKKFAGKSLPLEVKNSPITHIFLKKPTYDNSEFLTIELHGTDETKILALEVDKVGQYVGIPHQVQNPESFFFPVMQLVIQILQEADIIKVPKLHTHRKPQPGDEKAVIISETTAAEKFRPAKTIKEASVEEPVNDLSLPEEKPNNPLANISFHESKLFLQIPIKDRPTISKKLQRRLKEGSKEDTIIKGEHTTIAVYKVSEWEFHIDVSDPQNPFIHNVTKKSTRK